MAFLRECKDDADITLTVLRDGNLLDFTLNKEAYKTSYVNYYDDGVRLFFASNEKNGNPTKKEDTTDKMVGLDQKTAYISLDQFEGDAAEQMEDALSFMESRGKTKLILDLRNNGGGYMTVLGDIAAMLIRNGGKGNFVFAYSESKSGFQGYKSGKYNYKSHLEKIVILANENTASASECLIGALSVHDSPYTSGDIVIEKNFNGIAKTYGKGIMQTTYRLLSGGAFKLTTAKIYWPDATTSIHGVGIVASGENAVLPQNALNRAIELISK
jgi:C-terminal processing protease CtpA/Prc